MKKLISIAVGILAGIEFAIIYTTLIHIFHPSSEFSSMGRIPFLIIFIIITGYVKNYLYNNENQTDYTKNQIITIIAIPILLIITWVVSAKFF